MSSFSPQLASIGLFLIAYAGLYNNESLRLPQGIAIGFACVWVPFSIASLFKH